jgi:hypothetical protein
MKVNHFHTIPFIYGVGDYIIVILIASIVSGFQGIFHKIR